MSLPSLPFGGGGVDIGGDDEVDAEKDDDPPDPMLSLLPRRPEAHEAHQASPQGTTTTEPSPIGERDRCIGHDEPGRWLSLRDALRAIGSLDRLYQLARDGKLRSREEADGRIEVWVTDRDCFGGEPTRRLDDTRLAESAVAQGVTCSELLAALAYTQLAEAQARSSRGGRVSRRTLLLGAATVTALLGAATVTARDLLAVAYAAALDLTAWLR